MRKISLALACASMGLVGSVQAASSASANIGNLTFRVIDLNPFDGIDASYSFMATAPGAGSTSLQVTANDAGASDSASKSRNQAFYTKTLNTDDEMTHAGATSSVSTAGVSASGFAAGPSTSFSASAGTNTSYSYYGGGLSLTANSVLIVTAEASVNAKATVGAGGGYCWYCDYSSASATFGLSYNYSTGPTYASYNYNDSLSTNADARGGYYDYQYDASLGYWVPVYIVAGDQDNSSSRSFSAVFVNSSSATQYASLSLSTSVNGYGTADFPVATAPSLPAGPTAAVPEADALALAVAGLGVAALVRRRRAA
ncbi:MAG: hypothetical protein ACM3VZ_10890 [Acidobacteriota bacterium]